MTYPSTSHDACHLLVSHETSSSSAECSRDKPSFSFVGTGFDNVGHRLGLATRTQISVCKSPFPSAGHNPVAGLLMTNKVGPS